MTYYRNQYYGDNADFTAPLVHVWIRLRRKVVVYVELLWQQVRALCGVLGLWLKDILAFFVDSAGGSRLKRGSFAKFNDGIRMRSLGTKSYLSAILQLRTQRGQSSFGNIEPPFRHNMEEQIMPRTANRTTISLTEAEIKALEQLKSHFDTPSVSETIRRSISQSSLLKRYSNEDGDLLVERDGKRYIIPSRS